MARKHVFEVAEKVPVSTETEPVAKQPERPLLGLNLRPSAPVGAISQSLETINSRASRAEEIERKLVEGQVVVELDPEVIDSAIVIDRLDLDSQQQDGLVAQIREHGQQVPILVRPHPEREGRYQLAYGHRRLAAVKHIGGTIKAVVRQLSDDQLVVSQGQENNSRENLSYIERCYFAARLEDKGFSRDIIMASLGVDKAALSRMINLVRQLPVDLIETIGSAPAIGRQKWAELAEILQDRSKKNRAIKLIDDDKFLSAASDERFHAVYRLVKAVRNRPTSSSWTATDGTRPVNISDSDTRKILTFDKRVDPKFGDFIQERLQALYDEFRKLETKE